MRALPSPSPARRLEEVERCGASVRLMGEGKLSLRGAGRLPAELREWVRRSGEELVWLLVERERWARRTTDRERR